MINLRDKSKSLIEDRKNFSTNPWKLNYSQKILTQNIKKTPVNLHRDPIKSWALIIFTNGKNILNIKQSNMLHKFKVIIQRNRRRKIASTKHNFRQMKVIFFLEQSLEMLNPILCNSLRTFYQITRIIINFPNGIYIFPVRNRFMEKWSIVISTNKP